MTVDIASKVQSEVYSVPTGNKNNDGSPVDPKDFDYKTFLFAPLPGTVGHFEEERTRLDCKADVGV